MMKRPSVLAIALVILVFVLFRFQYGYEQKKVTTWDAFGYYMYLPSVFIYHDVKKLDWVDNIDKQYQLTGGKFYQATKLETGTFTNKYLAGVAILQMPFFFLGHWTAAALHYPQDGFSEPYQLAIIWGALFWVAIGFISLRKSLLYFFSEYTTTICLLVLGLCSNLIQYASIDAAQSHVWIFTLYAFVIWLTILWHQKPKYSTAFFIGIICGLATIARPTELIIFFIPLLWNSNTKLARKKKWELVAKHKMQILTCIVGGLVAILPQLLYWHYTTGKLIYDVGSKWYFLNPWFRVLFGSEKGWFLYTPCTILMVLGLFRMKNFAFQKSVLVFCLLNIWIVLAWSDWRYGGSYSSRALVQSYPMLAFGLATFINTYFQKRHTVLLTSMFICLVALNFYQLHLYNKGGGG